MRFDCLAKFSRWGTDLAGELVGLAADPDADEVGIVGDRLDQPGTGELRPDHIRKRGEHLRRRHLVVVRGAVLQEEEACAVLREGLETIPPPAEALAVGTAIELALHPGVAIDHVLERCDDVIVLGEAGMVEDVSRRGYRRLPAAFGGDVHNPFVGRLVPIEIQTAKDHGGEILEACGNRDLRFRIAKAARRRAGVVGYPSGEELVGDASAADGVVGFAIAALFQLHHPGLDDAHPRPPS